MYGLARLKTFSRVLQKGKGSQITQLRNGGAWAYRTVGPTPPKNALLFAEFVGFATWYWILYHIWHEPEHLTGHYPIPDPTKWTDEELGIPPDEEG